MPLTVNRPGVFSARRMDSRGWWVADPARGVELEAEWRTNFAPTNRSTRGRVAWWAIFAVGSTVSVVAGVLLIVAVDSPSWLTTGKNILAGLLMIVGLGGSLALAERSVPTAPPVTDDEFDSVVAVSRSVARWADDSIPAQDLWDLSLGLHQLSTLEADLEEFELEADVTGDETDRPRLEASRAAQLQVVTTVAERLGYPIPKHLTAPTADTGE